MKTETESERLLADVLAEDAPPGFREELLVRTLQQARRRRQVRQLNRVLVVTVVLVIVGFLLWPGRKPAVIARMPQSQDGNLNIIATTALPPGMEIETRSGTASVISTDSATLRIISTSPGSGQFQELSDEQLLAMTDGRPSVLVRTGPHQAELLVVDAAGGITSVVESSRQ